MITTRETGLRMAILEGPPEDSGKVHSGAHWRFIARWVEEGVWREEALNNVLSAVVDFDPGSVIIVRTTQQTLDANGKVVIDGDHGATHDEEFWFGGFRMQKARALATA